MGFEEDVLARRSEIAPGIQLAAEAAAAQAAAEKAARIAEAKAIADAASNTKREKAEAAARIRQAKKEQMKPFIEAVTEKCLMAARMFEQENVPQKPIWIRSRTMVEVDVSDSMYPGRTEQQRQPTVRQAGTAWHFLKSPLHCAVTEEGVLLSFRQLAIPRRYYAATGENRGFKGIINPGVYVTDKPNAARELVESDLFIQAVAYTIETHEPYAHSPAE